MLLVDDHPGFRRCARSLLTEEGFDVVGEAGDGATAVALAFELEPDLVLLDIQLPDANGFEIAAQLLERTPGLTIVLISSRDRLEYGRAVEASGARGFLAKDDLSGAALEELLR
ncbi:MAG TPA: response regulator transcription factor [Gaiellaceae bacterium]|nr:response regulator transcription factor [Gaiellaceae bacterium]